MTAGEYVKAAIEMAASLEGHELAKGCERKQARAKVAVLFGIPRTVLHGLRYRPPKTIAADIFDRLCVAVERQARAEIRNLENEIAKANARRLGSRCGLERAADAADRGARTLLGGSDE